jgi:competence protein ComEA
MIKLKNILNKIAFKFLYFKYEKNKQFYLSVLLLIIIGVIILTLLIIKQYHEAKVNENILAAVFNSNSSSIKNNDNDLLKESNKNNNLGELLENKTNNNLANNSINKNIDDSNDNYNASNDTSLNLNKETNQEVTSQSTASLKIKVYICGQINNAGVYELNANSRVIDLITLAGGAKEDANLESLNLAEILVDGQKVYIPSNKEVSSQSFNYNNDTNNNFFKNKLININFASKSELENLPGIGPELAQRIIDYRTNIGSFKKKEDIKNVTGIGDKKYESIKDLITV